MNNAMIDVLPGQINLVTHTDTISTNNYEHGRVFDVSIVKDDLTIGNDAHSSNRLIDFVFDSRFKTDFEVEPDLENIYYDIPGCIPDLIDDEIN